MKPMFIIDNVKITNRRIIANEFNNYFVSLASNLNKAYTELGEARIHMYTLPPCVRSLRHSRVTFRKMSAQSVTSAEVVH